MTLLEEIRQESQKSNYVLLSMKNLIADLVSFSETLGMDEMDFSQSKKERKERIKNEKKCL